MAKYCIVGEVKEEYVEKYKALHKNLYKGPYRELLGVIKSSGVQEEVIFIYKDLAIVFYEAEDLNESYEKQEGKQVVRQWNSLMRPMFVSYGFDSGKLPTLEKVFDLNEQLKLSLKERSTNE